MTVKLLTEHHLEFLILKGGNTGSSESTLVKMPHYWKSYATAQIMVSLSYSGYHRLQMTANFDFLKKQENLKFVSE